MRRRFVDCIQVRNRTPNYGFDRFRRRVRKLTPLRGEQRIRSDRRDNGVHQLANVKRVARENDLYLREQPTAIAWIGFYCWAGSIGGGEKNCATLRCRIVSKSTSIKGSHINARPEGTFTAKIVPPLLKSETIFPVASTISRGGLGSIMGTCLTADVCEGSNASSALTIMPHAAVFSFVMVVIICIVEY